MDLSKKFLDSLKPFSIESISLEADLNSFLETINEFCKSYPDKVKFFLIFSLHKIKEAHIRKQILVPKLSNFENFRISLKRIVAKEIFFSFKILKQEKTENILKFCLRFRELLLLHSRFNFIEIEIKDLLSKFCFGLNDKSFYFELLTYEVKSPSKSIDSLFSKAIELYNFRTFENYPAPSHYEIKEKVQTDTIKDKTKEIGKPGLLQNNNSDIVQKLDFESINVIGEDELEEIEPFLSEQPRRAENVNFIEENLLTTNFTKASTFANKSYNIAELETTFNIVKDKATPLIENLTAKACTAKTDSKNPIKFQNNLKISIANKEFSNKNKIKIPFNNNIRKTLDNNNIISRLLTKFTVTNRVKKSLKVGVG